MAEEAGTAMIIWTALVGGAGGVVGALGKDWLERRTRIDEGLRAKRTELYADLWKLSGILPKWPRNKEVTYQGLLERSERMRHWYFETGGGLYLSEPSRAAYGKAQEAIVQTVESKMSSRPENSLEKSDYDRVRDALSALRTELARDLHSRARVSSI